ncbi:hypothetical protein LNKW23_40130 [Paralimibaculum aggregatum]|uniref:DUF1493 family protein n=1 Tax=Paralimibaculum aggregatum TaxID=3036245 RepID=A0ABQ6LNK0_9RHOB|nr:DUF1493 family protein [Limibaculum sp. NKW23]GMG84797.1 hypothetical protein LNKW23_40130 [Limibaculum sp. NKW23]
MTRVTHLDRVRALVAGHAGVPAEEIEPEHRLVEHLKITAREGRGLLEAFADEFDVDIAAVDPASYFDDEPRTSPRRALMPVAAALWPAYRARLKRAGRARRSLGVRDLVASARAGRWIAPQTPRADADLARLEIPELLWLLGLGAAPAAFAEIDPWYGAAGLALGWAILLFGWARSFPWLARLEAAAEREHGPG